MEELRKRGPDEFLEVRHGFLWLHTTQVGEFVLHARFASGPTHAHLRSEMGECRLCRDLDLERRVAQWGK